MHLPSPNALKPWDETDIWKPLARNISRWSRNSRFCRKHSEGLPETQAKRTPQKLPNIGVEGCPKTSSATRSSLSTMQARQPTTNSYIYPVPISRRSGQKLGRREDMGNTRRMLPPITNPSDPSAQE